MLEQLLFPYTTGAEFVARRRASGAGASGALDAEPSARQGGSLPHRRQADMTERRIRYPEWVETDTVVLDAKRVTLDALLQRDLDLGRVRVFAHVDERLLGDAVEDHSHALRRFGVEVTLHPIHRASR